MRFRDLRKQGTEHNIGVTWPSRGMPELQSLDQSWGSLGDMPCLSNEVLPPL